jgi:D-sedoheptulose 7-phosphate isomerase
VETVQDIDAYFEEAAGVLRATGRACGADIMALAAAIVAAVQQGGTVLLGGNGGSAAEAQHFSAELVGRLTADVERPAIPALALTSEAPFLSAYANDYDFEGALARQIEALGRPGDILILISTSGNSANLCRAAAVARERGLICLGLLGSGGGRLAGLVERAVVVPGSATQHIQESHAAIVHLLCALVERRLFPGNGQDEPDKSAEGV